MIWLASALTAVLGTVAALHAYWGLGGVWPERNASDLARAVVGDGSTRMPPPWACFGVAGLLLILAIWPWVMLAYPLNHPVLVIGIVAAAIFVVRGLAGYSPRWRQRFSAQPFAKRDRRIYSPICLLVAAGLLSLVARGM